MSKQRFTLGEHSAKGWHVFDGLRMRTFYYDAPTRGEANEFVRGLNDPDVVSGYIKRIKQHQCDVRAILRAREAAGIL